MSTRPAAFPAGMPPSVADRAAIVEHDWHAFSGLDHLVDHWNRPGWRDNERILYWLVDLSAHAELTRLVTTCQRALRGMDGLDVVSPSSLHITILRVGLEAEIAPELMKRAADGAAVRLERRHAFELTVGPLAGSAGAVRFSVAPWSYLMAMAKDLAESTAEALGRAPAGQDRFRPHVSIAYNNRRQAAETVIDAVARLRDLPSVEVMVDTVNLVSLVRRQRAYRWTTRRTLELPP